MSEIRIYSKYGCHICQPMVLARIEDTERAEDDPEALPEVDDTLFED